MQCKIEWDVLSPAQWEERYARARRSSLLQSLDYARALETLDRQKTRRGLIYIEGQEAGFAQIREAGVLRNMLHAVSLDGGPLWFEGCGGPAQEDAFFRAFARRFPRRPGRRRRVIPAGETDLSSLGFKKMPGARYETIWLDLMQGIETLRADLKPAWRGALGKAEKQGLHIEWDVGGKNLPLLLTNYQSDKRHKGYDGPSLVLLRRLCSVFAENRKLLTGVAQLDNRAIAAILILCHGRAATYQVGWSSAEGRRAAAHNLLLWQGVCRLKDMGFCDFDLGGVNDDTAQGVKRFKEGMGGTPAASGLFT